MLSKRIFGTLLITIIFTTVAQAQSTGRKLWPRGEAGPNPMLVLPEQAAEQTPVEAQEAQGGGVLDILARQKTAAVGSWLGSSSEGARVLFTFNSDGTLTASVQGEVSTNPELGVLTPGHGVWKHLGGRQFGFTSIGVLYDIGTGAYLGYLKARSVLTLNGAGDQLSGRDKVEVFDSDGNVVFTATGATNFKRIQFEPLD